MTIKNKKGTELTISASGIDTFNDLARRAVACRHWRWMPGMREARTGERYEDGDGPWIVNKWPDLTDPATVGALLALVREAWKDPHLHVGRRIAGWGVWTSESTPLPQCVGKGDTEAEALIAALKAAP